MLSGLSVMIHFVTLYLLHYLTMGGEDRAVKLSGSFVSGREGRVWRAGYGRQSGTRLQVTVGIELLQIVLQNCTIMVSICKLTYIG